MIDDPLEELQMVPPHLDDDGFTLGVMAALPPRRRDLRPWLDGATVMALALAVVLMAPELLAAGAAWLAEATHLPVGLAPAALVATLATAGALALGGWWLAIEGRTR